MSVPSARWLVVAVALVIAYLILHPHVQTEWYIYKNGTMTDMERSKMACVNAAVSYNAQAAASDKNNPFLDAPEQTQYECRSRLSLNWGW